MTLLLALSVILINPSTGSYIDKNNNFNPNSNEFEQYVTPFCFTYSPNSSTVIMGEPKILHWTWLDNNPSTYIIYNETDSQLVEILHQGNWVSNETIEYQVPVNFGKVEQNCRKYRICVFDLDGQSANKTVTLNVVDEFGALDAGDDVVIDLLKYNRYSAAIWEIVAHRNYTCDFEKFDKMPTNFNCTRKETDSLYRTLAEYEFAELEYGPYTLTCTAKFTEVDGPNSFSLSKNITITVLNYVPDDSSGKDNEFVIPGYNNFILMIAGCITIIRLVKGQEKKEYSTEK